MNAYLFRPLFYIFSMVILSMAICITPSAASNGALNDKGWSLMKKPVAASPEVIEFFSFYCPPCYQISQHYPVVEKINARMPKGKKVVKYHVSAMGSLGYELTEAWAIAVVSGKSDELEMPLFTAVQSKKIRNVDDIQSLFALSGISKGEYKKALASPAVKEFIAEQQAAVKKFNVTGTPSFYVKGQYQMDPGGIKAKSPEEFVNAFSELVIHLVNMNDTQVDN